MKEAYKKRIELFLKKSGKKALSYKELAQKCKVKKNEYDFFNLALEELEDGGIIVKRRTGFLLSEVFGAFPAHVDRINRTFGFLKRDDDGSEIFVPGKFLKGAMPGDLVLAKLIRSRTGSPEGEVLKVLEENNSRFTGVVVDIEGQKYVRPDSFAKNPVAIVKSRHASCEVGDKVMAEIAFRGEKHADHRAKIISSFGEAGKASVCAKSVLELNGVSLEFPLEVLDEAKRVAAVGIPEDEAQRRLDLRDEVIFTIDGADTKDIDDAVSIKKFENFYELGVHIADVSYYVKPGSALDREALERGTSIYFADKVIPMLPKELSNGICSLNPNEDRLAFSCIMIVGKDGKLEDFDFKKTIIRSRVKGVYSEINQILAGTESPEIKEKYKEVRESLVLMEELAEILTANRIKRGSPQLETTESKIIVDENDVCIGVKPRERGKSELIIEEFMLMANQSAATLGKMQQIPFVYRVHENPAPEKIEKLRETILRMGLSFPNFTQIRPKHLAEILESQRGTKLFPVINKLVLRSMAKAKYSIDPIGHFGLVLDDYAHFTSPIRRYPDLSIHRILSDLIKGVQPALLRKKYLKYAMESANHSTEMELVAMRVEQECEDCYKAEYMNSHLGEEFEGVISSVTEFGFYVELPNTVEGLVHIDSFEDGLYDFDGLFSINNMNGGERYSIGDTVKVICAKADVSSGKIDFKLIEKIKDAG